MTLVSLLCLASAISAAASPKPAPAPPPALPTTHRPEAFALEDQFARAFERRRAENHLRKLTRIADRALLRQLVCTASISDRPPLTPLALESQADNALLAVSAADDLPPALRRVADYDDHRTAAGRRVHRYSIAVFASPTVPGQFWVGVGLYWSYLTEWLALRSGTYTHIAARAVAPACTDVR